MNELGSRSRHNLDREKERLGEGERVSGSSLDYIPILVKDLEFRAMFYFLAFNSGTLKTNANKLKTTSARTKAETPTTS